MLGYGGIPDELMVITVVTSRGKKCCHAEITYLVTRFSCRAGPLRGPKSYPPDPKRRGPRENRALNELRYYCTTQTGRVKKPE